jgi:hypothetical protein
VLESVKEQSAPHNRTYFLEEISYKLDTVAEPIQYQVQTMGGGPLRLSRPEYNEVITDDDEESAFEDEPVNEKGGTFAV